MLMRCSGRDIDIILRDETKKANQHYFEDLESFQPQKLKDAGPSQLIVGTEVSWERLAEYVQHGLLRFVTFGPHSDSYLTKLTQKDMQNSREPKKYRYHPGKVEIMPIAMGSAELNFASTILNLPAKECFCLVNLKNEGHSLLWMKWLPQESNQDMALILEDGVQKPVICFWTKRSWKSQITTLFDKKDSDPMNPSVQIYPHTTVHNFAMSYQEMKQMKSFEIKLHILYGLFWFVLRDIFCGFKSVESALSRLHKEIIFLILRELLFVGDLPKWCDVSPFIKFENSCFPEYWYVFFFFLNFFKCFELS